MGRQLGGFQGRIEKDPDSNSSRFLCKSSGNFCRLLLLLGGRHLATAGYGD